MILSWGKPTIEIGLLGDNDAVPTEWIKVDNPVEDSAKLETAEGETKDAKGEGGELVDKKRKVNTYTFSFELFKKKGKDWPVKDVDGVIVGYYAMRLTPEDSTVPGISFTKSMISSQDTYNAADGQKKQYKMDVITDSNGTIKPYTAPTTAG